MTPTKIEWTQETWNPVTGCTKVSDGCDHCYAEAITNRFNGKGAFDTIVLHPERLDAPLRRRKPTTYFVNSMSDLFHAEVPAEFVAEVWEVMGATPQHTYQILTKRPARAREILRRFSTGTYLNDGGLFDIYPQPTDALLAQMNDPAGSGWPLPNVWLGVSVENQEYADKRIPVLLDTPAAVRFLSCEPLLGGVDLQNYLGLEWFESFEGWGHEMFAALQGRVGSAGGLHWVIAGGESGPKARPMHPDWARSLRDQCVAAEVPFFFKQWGAFTPNRPTSFTGGIHETLGVPLYRMMGKSAGRDLDGRTWDEMPVSDA